MPEMTPPSAQTMLELADEFREFTAMKYAGDCKCGKCQLVPRELIDRVCVALRASQPAAQALDRDAMVRKIAAALAAGKDSGGYDTLLDMCAHIALSVVEDQAPAGTGGDVREQIAQIIDPRAFIIPDSKQFEIKARQREARDRADAILALSPPQAPDAVREALHAKGRTKAGNDIGGI